MKLRALLLLVTALAAVNADWIDHDQVQPFVQPEPVTISEKAAVKFKPQLHITNGCHPYPAVNAAGDTGLRALYMVQRRLGHYVLVVFPERFAIARPGYIGSVSISARRIFQVRPAQRRYHRRYERQGKLRKPLADQPCDRYNVRRWRIPRSHHVGPTDRCGSRCPAKHGLWRRQCAHERRQLSLKSRKSVAILMEVIAVDIHPIFPIKAPC
ncbi:hypothetical protein JG688_00004644 [Phytophthora aleatoria]|uniref:Uncharacterized protein n=1 Tax=Phytophthora aleatoria TaxID=2496075 RepID=A0A8J5MHY3_9STRA|nr:hypothetical protein JG688_00004644 [Phytophthora aleatoria]